MNAYLGNTWGVIWSVVVGLLIALLPQDLWSGLIATNLKTSPAIPWSVVVMAVLLWLMLQYLGGKFWPPGTSEARRRYLRANRVQGPVFAWAVLAGGLAITALSGYWMVLAQLIRMPGSVLPPLDKVPRLTVMLAVGMGSLVSPICEQAGFWGYCQAMLQQRFKSVTAIVISALVFAILPHPPLQAPYLPRLGFFLLIGLTFSAMAYFTNSILPGMLVHILGLLSFFVWVWPHDPGRQLLSQGGADTWFYLHAAQAVVFTALAVLAFAQLARAARNELRGSSAGSVKGIRDGGGDLHKGSHIPHS